MESNIKNQATINIGTLGHVSHGKSTFTHALTGIKPMKHSKEKELSLTIKLGYANFKLYKCDTCPEPDCYHHFTSDCNFDTEILCTNILCDGKMRLIKHYSVLDMPGHNSLMATMMSGAATMDCAVLVIAANQPVPQPQTSEHLAVADMLGIDNIIILQNKIDLVSRADVEKNYAEIVSFVKGTVAEGKPIIPVSCVHEFNMDVVMHHLDKFMKEPEHKIDDLPILNVVRSFDVNKVGSSYTQIVGGVIGGTLKQGKLSIGQIIEIRPGRFMKDTQKCVPWRSAIVSLFSEKNRLTEAVSGGLIAIGTNLDPSLTKEDKLQGQVIGLEGKLPDVYLNLEVKFKLMKYLIGSDNMSKIKRLQEGEILRVNCGSLTAYGKIESIKNHILKIHLDKPVCLMINDMISLSRKEDKSWRLIGCGVFKNGIPLAIEYE
jgi:translation initiation factor 2 subunit 3